MLVIFWVLLGAGNALAFAYFFSGDRLAGLVLDKRRNWHVLVPHLIRFHHLRYPIQYILFPFLLITLLSLEGPFLLNHLRLPILCLSTIPTLTFLPIILFNNNKRIVLSRLYLHFLSWQFFFVFFIHFLLVNILDDFLIFFWGGFSFCAFGQHLISAGRDRLKKGSLVGVKVFVVEIFGVVVLSHSLEGHLFSWDQLKASSLFDLQGKIRILVGGFLPLLLPIFFLFEFLEGA